MRWNGAGWDDIGGLLYPGGTPLGVGWVSAMLPTQGGLIVAGGFKQAGPAAAVNLARWDGLAWSELAAGAPPLEWYSVPWYHFDKAGLAAGPGGLYLGSSGVHMLQTTISVPVLALALHAQPVPLGVRLDWELPAGSAVEELRLERRNPRGETVRLGAWPDPAPRGSWVDLSVPANEVSSYQAIARSALAEVRSAEVMVDRTGGMSGQARSGIVAVRPNPCNPRATIELQLEPGHAATLQIVNTAGRRVRRFDLRALPAGEQAVQWGGTDDAGNAVASGAYLVVLQSRSGVEATRIAVIR